MKTRDLIAQLQNVDPSGELDVVIDNEPVRFAQRVEAYWDGYMLDIIGPHNAPLGARIVTQGWKVSLHRTSLENLLVDFPNIEVNLDQVPEHSRKQWIRRLEEERRENEEVIASRPIPPASPGTAAPPR